MYHGAEKDIKDGCMPTARECQPSPTEKAVLHNSPGLALLNVVQNSMVTLEKMADQFAAAIPDRQISMAGLQGYLMLHKNAPNAISHVAAWALEQTQSHTASIDGMPEAD